MRLHVSPLNASSLLSRYAIAAGHSHIPRDILCFFFQTLFCGSDLGKLAKPSYQTVLMRVLGIRNQSSPVLQ